MQDKQLYQQILGLEHPWKVAEVDLKVEEEEITVHVECAKQRWACPECRKRMHVHDYERRRWRHLDSCQFRTILEANVPRVKCPDHGTQMIQVPWAEKHSRFTMLFECFALEVLKACSASKASELLAITWDQADGIKQRAVARGMARRELTGLKHVCVDEKAVGRGHDYVTVVTGIIDGEAKVLYLGDGRGEEGLNGFWELLGPEGCEQIEAVSMDMSRSYQNSTARYCPDAELIFDPFHIMKMLNKAVDEVRRRELVLGTKRERASLKKTRQMWLWGEENLPERHADRFDVLKESTLKTARAWRLKELWRTFRDCVDVDDGLAFFKRWSALAMRSKLEPIKKVARSLKKHLAGIVTVLKYGFCNATAEGMNNRIQLMVQKACGYRNRARLKTDILFHLGGLDLNPVFTQ